MPKQILDDITAIKKTDKAGMLKVIAEFPEIIDAGIKLGEKSEVKLKDEVLNIIVSGMGGSAIGGDILSQVVSEKVDIPVYVNRNYNISGQQKNALFFAVSYSGNTEETLSALKEARERGFKIICITSGGKLKREAEENGYPLILVPGGHQPRAALGFLFTPMLVMLEKIGVVEGLSRDLKKTVELLSDLRQNYGEEIPTKLNPAKKLATKLRGTVPIVYGTSGLNDVAALRWETQLNENSKILAFTNSFPEMNHNEIVGISTLKPRKHKFSIIILRDANEDPKIKKRIEATKTIIRKNISNITDVWAKGESKLERLISLIYFGDYLSAYLAVLNGVDPTPVTVIEKLKRELSK